MEPILVIIAGFILWTVSIFVFYKIFENLLDLIDNDCSNVVLLKEIIRRLKALNLKKPGYVFLVQKFEGDDGMLKFVLMLPAKAAPDVVSRELVVSIDGQATTVVLGADQVETAEMVGQDNASVTGSLVDVDDAGNRSPAREFSFTLLDTFPPAQPGEIGLKVTGEDFPVTPEPQPE